MPDEVSVATTDKVMDIMRFALRKPNMERRAIVINFNEKHFHIL